MNARRRVPGLRREEVAMLADVSVDYYTRLEQGRETGPSAQVLDALAEALALDDDGRGHLFVLAGLAPRPRSDIGAERVEPHLLRLIDSWTDTPTLIVNGAFDILAWNRLGEALFSGFSASCNLVETIFCDPAARSFYLDWEAAAQHVVAAYRLSEGTAPGHPRIREVVDGLLAHSPDFTRLWNRNEARGKRPVNKGFIHPEVGELTLWSHSFDVVTVPGQQMVCYHAEPASRSAEALRLLGTIAATSLQEQAVERTE